jgi:YHS domain-containing protein
MPRRGAERLLSTPGCAAGLFDRRAPEMLRAGLLVWRAPGARGVFDVRTTSVHYFQKRKNPMKTRLWIGSLAAAVLAVAVAGSFAEEKAAEKEAKCPVSGKAINKDATAEFNGGTVYFCCNNCPKAFKADSKKFATKANHQMAVTGQLKQVGCPLSGKKCAEGTEIEVAGVKVAYCCNNCKGNVAKLSADEQMEKVFADVSKSFKAPEKK